MTITTISTMRPGSLIIPLSQVNKGIENVEPAGYPKSRDHLRSLTKYFFILQSRTVNFFRMKYL
jgi:hypothetical protein